MRSRHIRHVDKVKDWTDRVDSANGGPRVPMDGDLLCAQDRTVQHFSTRFSGYNGWAMIRFWNNYPYRSAWSNAECLAVILCPFGIATGLVGTWTNENFVGNELNIDGLQGVKANSTSLDTNETVPDLVPGSYATQLTYNYTNPVPVGAGEYEMGVCTGFNSTYDLAPHLNVTPLKLTRAWDSFGARVTEVPDFPGGYFSIKIPALSTLQMYRWTPSSQALVASNIGSGSKPDNSLNYRVMSGSFYTVPGPLLFTAKRVSTSAIVDSLTASEGYTACGIAQFTRTQFGGGFRT